MKVPGLTLVRSASAMVKVPTTVFNALSSATVATPIPLTGKAASPATIVGFAV